MYSRGQPKQPIQFMRVREFLLPKYYWIQTQNGRKRLKNIIRNFSHEPFSIAKILGDFNRIFRLLGVTLRTGQGPLR